MARTLTNKPRSNAGFRTLPGFGKHIAQIEACNEAMLDAGFCARSREQKTLRPSPYDDIRPSHD